MMANAPSPTPRPILAFVERAVEASDEGEVGVAVVVWTGDGAVVGISLVRIHAKVAFRE